MSNKTIAISVKLTGAEAQLKKLNKLEQNTKELTMRKTELNKQTRKSGIVTKKYSREMALLNTQLKANRRSMLVLRQEMLGIDGFTTRLGKSFRKMGSSMVAGFAGLFAVQQVFQIIKDGIEVVQKFEQQMANVKAITGATATEFKFLSDNAKELGSTTIFTATQVGQLQEELSKLGFSTGEILASSEAILQLAQATGSDLAEASVVAGATLRGFGLEASDMQTVVDVMAKSFTSSALDMEKFKESMKLVAPIAKTTETSLQDASAALSILADRGVSGSLAGTQLRKIMADLATKTGVSFQESLQITQDRLAEATSSSEKLAIAKELVGERAKGSLIALAENRDELIGLSVEYQNAAGSAEEMSEIMADTSEGASKRFSSAWEGMLLSIDDGNADTLTKVKNWGADMLNWANKSMQEFNKLQEIGSKRKINFFGGTTEFQDELLVLMNAQEELRKKIIDDDKAISDAKLKSAVKVNEYQKEAYLAQQKGDNERATKFAEMTLAEKKHFDELVKMQDELASKAKVKKHKELIELGEAEEEKVKVLTEAEKKAQEKAAKEKEKAKNKAAKEQQKAEEKLSKMIVKLKQNQLILEIEDKREAEFMKLDIAKQNAIAEIELTKATEETKKKARLAIDDKFLAQENALKAKYDAEDKKAQEKIDAKEKAKSDKEKEKETADKLELREKQLQFAQETADLLAEVTSARVTRQKDLALASLDAQLQQGLINQQQFDKQREDIERKAFQQQKKIDIASALANGAIAITKTVAQLGGVGAITPMGIASLGLVAAQTAAQVGIIAGQSFDKGGYTGSGFGSADSSGFKQAGVVHEGEYVVPKNVLESQRGSSLVGALEAMRTSRPQPFSNIGFANGGFAGASGVDMSELENRITRAVASSIGSIQVVNNATDTITQAAKVNNIQSEATFG